jgi:hypothetical protein
MESTHPKPAANRAYRVVASTCPRAPWARQRGRRPTIRPQRGATRGSASTSAATPHRDPVSAFLRPCRRLSGERASSRHPTAGCMGRRRSSPRRRDARRSPAEAGLRVVQGAEGGYPALPQGPGPSVPPPWGHRGTRSQTAGTLDDEPAAGVTIVFSRVREEKTTTGMQEGADPATAERGARAARSRDRARSDVDLAGGGGLASRDRGPRWQHVPDRAPPARVPAPHAPPAVHERLRRERSRPTNPSVLGWGTAPRVLPDRTDHGERLDR